MKKCSRCKLIKDESEFYIRNKKRGTHQGWCKKCAKEYRSGEYFQKNKQREREYDKERYRKTREKILEYLGSHPCVDCGEKDIIVLTFDHIKGKKIECISNMIKSHGWESIKKEIKKCC